MKKTTKFFLLIAALVAWGSTAYAVNTECAGTSTEAVAGTFDLGYNYSFTTSGTDVTITFKVLDIKEGLVAQIVTPSNAFTGMSSISGETQAYTVTLTGQTIGSTITYAGYFPYAGGALRTANLTYTVGNTCGPVVVDEEKPTMGDASVVGSPTFNSIDLLLAATDDITTPVTSFVANDATNSITNKAITADASGNATVTGLAASTSYNLVITAKDAAGNISDNSATVVFTTPAEPALSTIDFETVGQDWTWTVSENGTNPALEFVDNPSAAGINTSTKAAKFTAIADANAWALTYSDNRTFTISNNNKTVKVMVYKDRISDFAVKYEGPGYARELKVANTLVNQWEELTFSFGDDIGKTVTKIVIIPDFLARTANTINYFDNISFSAGSDITPPVMGAVSVVGSPAFNSVNILLAATDNVTSPVTSFIANDATNSITDKAITADASGNAIISGLNASTSYNLVIKAKDATGNTSTNSTTVSFTTPAPPAVTTINFETVGQDWTWTVGENGTNPALEFVDNPSSTGINTSTKAAKFTATAAGNAWALVFSSSRPYLISNDNKIIKVMVYKDRISNFGLKLETTDGALELTVPNTLINTWEELTFDFSSKVGTTVNNFVIIPDFLARTDATINYFDNISFSNGMVSSLGANKSDNLVRCYPNPMNNTINVSASSEISQVIVRNILGQTVKTITVNQLEKSLDLSAVSAGNYFVTVKMTNGQISTQKVVKL
ncbi:MAG: T9SS type A sorting domain-containing protein [Paludibacter sp.]|nr:T9SS type A sorting domain-containing protein [Paludibacter sp.]